MAVKMKVVLDSRAFTFRPNPGNSGHMNKSRWTVSVNCWLMSGERVL